MKGFWLLLAMCSICCAGPLSAASPTEARCREPVTPIPVRLYIPNPQKVKLGRLLFHDRRLSRNLRRSCASCHDLATNGASSLRFDTNDSGSLQRFHTPTVFNATMSFRLNWEGNIRSPRTLIFNALHRPELMGGERGIAVTQLQADKMMSTRFRQVYAGEVSEARIIDALYAFQETLVTPNAPFDRWLRGKPSALTAQQKRGYEAFKSVGCASCHQGVNIGGNLYQKRGVFHPLGSGGPTVLRVPSLRNVGVTPPYFHDGSAPTLDEAVRLMGTTQLNLAIGQRDLNDIVAFLHSLTGEYRGRSLTSPGRSKAAP